MASEQDSILVTQQEEEVEGIHTSQEVEGKREEQLDEVLRRRFERVES